MNRIGVILTVASLLIVGCAQAPPQPASSESKESASAQSTDSFAKTGENAASGPTSVVGFWRIEISPERLARFKKAGLATPFLTIRFTEKGAFEAGYVWGDDKRKAVGTYKVDGQFLVLTTTKINGKKPQPGRAPEKHTITEDGNKIVTAQGSALVRVKAK